MTITQWLTMMALFIIFALNIIVCLAALVSAAAGSSCTRLMSIAVMIMLLLMAVSADLLAILIDF